VDETLFTVHINPYFLRLNFSHTLVEDDESTAQYDPSTGCLTVTLTKEVKGQEFKDLDLLTKLLAPKRTTPQPCIEVLSTEDSAPTGEEELTARTRGLSLEHQEILAGRSHTKSKYKALLKTIQRPEMTGNYRKKFHNR
jgi:protein SHQ1